MMDGTPTLRLNDYVCDSILNNKLTFDTESVRGNLPEPVPINFSVNKEVQTFVDQAQSHFRELIDQHEVKVLQYLGYGKNLIKKFKCSPDAYVQMIIQLAYFKM